MMSEQSKRIVSIHQPNFLPWPGYFQKIFRSDVFIYLDSVQYPKTGGSWLNRNKFVEEKTENWYTLPITRNFHGTRNINEILIKDIEESKRNFFAKLTKNYAAAPFFRETNSVLLEIFEKIESNLCNFNIYAIDTLCSHLDLGGIKKIRSSSLQIEKNSNELLVTLVLNVGGDKYLCGAGSSKYIDEDFFKKNAVEIIYQQYSGVIYKQFHSSGFTPNLSIVDMLMNLGKVQSSNLIKRGFEK